MDSRFSPSPASTAGQSVARAAFRTAFPHTIPMLLGFLFLGIGCGVFAHGMGLAPWVAPVMAAAIFGGSLEFVAVSLLLSPFAPFQVLILALVIQSRHLFYGISLLENTVAWVGKSRFSSSSCVMRLSPSTIRWKSRSASTGAGSIGGYPS